MARIFLSHSSANNAQVLALAQWLEREGWNDFFLDIDPAGDLTPGQRWQEALKNATHRCEAVVFLISPAWVKSNHCVAEFLLAKQLGKRIFGVIVESTPFGEIPSEMTSEWQLCDLVNGEAREQWTVARDPLVRSTVISFPVEGLRRLRNGLQKAGLDALSFDWPPERDPDRVPYRGLKPLDVDDCAVYFGRESAIVRGLDELRNMRATGVERLLVVLGASGSGKSSFIRAGVWPRLARDDLHFVPLAVIRPQRAAVTGDAGLICALDHGLRRFGIVRTRAAIAASLESETGLAAVLQEIQQAAARSTLQTTDPPSVVLLIDQAEELLATEGQAEATRLVELLASVLRAPPSADAQARASRLLALVVFAIRSDSFTALQQRVELSHVAIRPFDLRALSAGEFKAVIEGPARRATAAGRKLHVQPQLTERLLEDSQGADALPLLAFILERLYREFGADGDLRLDEYDTLGGVQGAIVSAIDSALADPRRHPQIPEAEADREAALHDAFIPWLAVVDPDTGQRRRRVAKWSEIPPQSRALLERLIEARLVVRDQMHADGGTSEPVVEVAHEALLRRWPLLTLWLDARAEQLQMLEAVRRAASEWHRRERNRDWLIHLDARLEAAEKVATEPRFRALLGEQGEAYLRACRDLTRERADERELQQRRVAEAQARTAEEQRRTAKAQRFGRIAIVAVGAFVIVAAIVVAMQRRAVSLQTSRVLVSEAQRAFREGLEPRAMRFAVLAARSGWLSPTDEKASPLLVDLLAGGHLRRTIETGGTVRYAKFSADSRYLLFAVAGLDRLRVWDRRSNRFTRLDIPFDLAFRQAEPVLTSDSRFVVAVKSNEIHFWNVETGERTGAAMKAAKSLLKMAVSADGRFLWTINEDDGFEIWDLARRERRELSEPPTAFAAFDARFSADNRHVLVLNPSRGAAILDLDDARPSFRIITNQSATGIAFSNDGKTAAVALNDGSVHFWDASGTSEVRDALRTATARDILEFSFDDSLLILANGGSGVVSVLPLGGDDVTIGDRRHQRTQFFPGFVPRGRGLLFADSDQSLRIVMGADSDDPDNVGIGLGQAEEIVFATFSPDGTTLATATNGERVTLWEMPVNQSFELGAGGQPQFAIFSADSSRVALFGRAGGSPNYSVSVWDVRSRAPVRAGLGQSDAALSFDFSSDGKRVVMSGDAVRVWDAVSGNRIGADLPVQVSPQDLKFSPDGQKVLVLGVDGFQICGIGPGATCSAEFEFDGLKRCGFSPDGTRVAATGEGGLGVWNIETAKRVIQDDDKAFSFAFSPDGLQVAFGLSRRRVTLRDTSSARSVELSLPGAPERTDAISTLVTGLAFSPNGKYLVATTEGAALTVWNADDRNEPVFSRPPGDGTRFLWFTPDSRTLAMGDGRRRQIRFLDIATAGMLNTAIPIDGDFDHLYPSSDGRWLLHLPRNGSARMWELDQGLVRARDELLRTLCEMRLGGASVVTETDVDVAPVVTGRIGEDVCEPRGWLSR